MSLFLLSCTKDSDLLAALVLANNEESVDEQSTETTETTETTEETENEPSTNPNRVVGTYYPASAAEITNASNVNMRAIITNSFDCNGCTFAENQTIEPGGGVISGMNIQLNGAYIENNYKQAFAATVEFSMVYDMSKLSPEIFGGIANDDIEDDGAIDALITNSFYGTALKSGKYIKNQESVYKRSGSFDWDMNNAVISTTDASALSHGSAVNNQNTYLFRFEIPNVTLFNGEFDGQDLASRAIFFNDVDYYDVRNLHVHNYYAPANAFARGIGIKWDIKDDFVEGQFHDNVVENIGAASDGSANNTPYGVSKAISFTVRTNNRSNLYFSGNRYENIYGDDAEGFINNRSSGYNYNTNQTNFFFENDKFIACQRRAVKINASNTHFNNCTFTSATNPPVFNGAQAALVNVFSITAGQEIKNIRMTNCTIEIVGDADNIAFAVTDATDCIFENNTFSTNYIHAGGSIGFAANGTQNGLYDGYLDNTVIFRNNTMTNLRINLGVVYNPQNGGPIITNNVQNLNIDRNVGHFWAALRLVSTSGQSDTFTIKDHVLNVDIQSTTGLTLFGGMFNTQGSEPKNLTFDNVTINYTGIAPPPHAFAYTGKNNTSTGFDSTNLIKDCTITGAVGAGSIVVKGTDKSVVIENSFGDSNSAFTTN